MRKDTETLINEIKNCNDIDSYFKKNKDDLEKMSLSSYLTEMLQKYSLTKSEVFLRAGMSGNNYGYEMFREDMKKPSRDKILQICMGYPMTLDEVQLALRCGKECSLNPRDRRDAIIMMAICKHYSILKMNEILEQHSLKIVG